MHNLPKSSLRGVAQVLPPTGERLVQLMGAINTTHQSPKTSYDNVQAYA